MIADDREAYGKVLAGRDGQSGAVIGNVDSRKSHAETGWIEQETRPERVGQIDNAVAEKRVAIFQDCVARSDGLARRGRGTDRRGAPLPHAEQERGCEDEAEDEKSFQHDLAFSNEEADWFLPMKGNAQTRLDPASS